MALIWCESFDGTATFAQLCDTTGNRKWFRGSGSFTIVHSLTNTAPARTGNYLRLDPGSSAAVPPRKAIPGSLTAVQLAMAMYLPSPAAAGLRGFGLLGSGGQELMSMSRLGGVTDKVRFQLTRSGGSSVFDTLDNSVPVNTWVWLEVLYRQGNPGRLEVWIDGALQFVSSDLNVTGMSAIQELLLGYGGGDMVVDTRFDDIIVCTDDHGFTGPVNVVCLRPDADGVTTEWTPSTGTDNFDLVNDQNLNDATYVSTDTDGDLDLYTFDDVPGAYAGYGVVGSQLTTRARAVGGDSDLTLQEDATDVGVQAITSTLATRSTILSGTRTIGDINSREYGYRRGA